MASETTLLWLQSGGCGGCTMSLLCAESPDMLTTLGAFGIRLLWHPSLSEAGASELHGLFADIKSGRQTLDILCLEGAVINGPQGSGKFHLLPGSAMPMRDLIRDLAGRARHVVAVGSCAAFGGVTAAGDNHVEATGLAFEAAAPGGLLGADHRTGSGLPVVNIAGCPTHPGWVLETLAQLAAGTLTAADLDAFGRPRFYADHLVHHGCIRNEYYEYKASAEELSQLGCMMEHLGCQGTQVHADCNIRPWNGGGSCTGGGYPCVACTEPGFERRSQPFLETPKIAGIPMGLPTDMPKAWFVALASLSKAATPARVRGNAVADRIVLPPACTRGRPTR